VSVDLELLHRHRRYESAEQGLNEEFLQPTLGLGRTVAVLSRPSSRARPTGYVICHSLGMEQIHLGRLDVIVARALAAAGFPVLRFHGQGYGDSESSMEVIGLSSHAAEADDAVALMGEQEGVDRVGVLGARIGGTVAALAADRAGLSLMALWEPIVRGGTYMRDLLRSELLAKMVAGQADGGTSDMSRLKEELSASGSVDIKGFRLSRAAHDEVASIDLTRDLQRFAGSSLLVSPSRTERANPTLVKLSDKLASQGGTCELRVVQDPFAAQFGQYRFQTVDGGRGKRDVQLELNEKIAAATIEWALAQERTQAESEADRA
jgi:pimeloyl-ACP methyl ester carboxylesterase